MLIHEIISVGKNTTILKLFSHLKMLKMINLHVISIAIEEHVVMKGIGVELT